MRLLPDMTLNDSIIIAGTGCNAKNAQAWLQPLQEACEKYDIASNNAVAAFLANIGVESESLTVFSENLNYSAQELAETWPQRFAVDSKARTYVPNAQALSLARKPQAIANNVYANRMGNGDVSSGDGWRYRGQGAIQITGRQMFTTLAGLFRLPLVAQPELLQAPVAGALAAAWFFQSRGCIAAAERNDFAQVVKLINGAAPNAANHGALREVRYKAALNALTLPTTSVAPPTPGSPSTP